jgi:hypothetical protein
MLAAIDSSSRSTNGHRIPENVNSPLSNPLPEWHAAFLRLAPKIRQHARVRFRNLNPVDREEAIQEVIARTLLDFLRLVEGGKGNLAYAGPLARFAVAQVRQGRRVGGRLNIRDVSSQYCQSRKSVSVKSLHCHALPGWHEVLVEDRGCTPAEIAAVRIDFREWLGTLSKRSRHLAERLAMGESTSSAASMFGISAARVSQLRRELHRAWNAFQNEPMPGAVD